MPIYYPSVNYYLNRNTGNRMRVNHGIRLTRRHLAEPKLASENGKTHITPMY